MHIRVALHEVYWDAFLDKNIREYISRYHMMHTVSSYMTLM